MQKNEPDGDVLAAMIRSVQEIPDHDEPAPIMQCPKCGYRAPIYLMLKPNKFPGTPRCPECESETERA